MAAEAFYPPAPAAVPAEITHIDSRYRLRVAAMIGGLLLFLMLYMLLVALAGLVAWWLVMLPMPDVHGRSAMAFLVFKFGGAFAAVLLWLFLFKGLFKGTRAERTAHVEVKEQDHPALFAFIRQVYQDAGAPRPRRVYVSPEVNAALIYDTSLVNLVIPPGKDLLIGLGLVNVVNLSEFKAVLAHEFGHFAQRSVGLGSYLTVANRTMHDVIYSRDALDRFVDRWAAQDLRVSFPAWGLKGVLWIVRKILAGTYQGLNLLFLSLSRQMEYNADNVAVSMTGSDALIHGLARLEFAQECLADAARSLDAAADHGLLTDDLFYHQTHAADRLRRLAKNERAGLPPVLPKDSTQQVQVFEPEDDGVPEHYRSHPADYMRERNAKRVYIRSPQDDRSPWILFGNPAPLKTAATREFYRQMLGRREDYQPRAAAEVQAFIDAEHAESMFNERYHGYYDDRFINPGDIQGLPDQPWTPQRAAAWLSAWPAADLAEQMEAFRRRQGEYRLLHGLKSGELALRGKTFPFREQQYSAGDVDRLLAAVDKELDASIEAMHRLDRDVFLAHWSIARQLDQADGAAKVREADLVSRYRFHMAVQNLLERIHGAHARLQALVNALSSSGQLSQEGFAEIRTVFSQMHKELTDCLDEAQSLQTPALSHVEAGSPLYGLIVDRSEGRLQPLSGDSISGEWVGMLAARLDGVLGRLRRVHSKSLGSLLASQERLAEEAGRPSAQSMPGLGAVKTTALAWLAVLLSAAATAAAEPAEQQWRDIYRNGFQVSSIGAGWQSPLTSSEATAEGLRIADPSTDKGSGRFFQVDWRVEPDEGAAVEARLKAVSCSEPWGVALLVADGRHEEGVTFFPDKVMLAASGVMAPFDAASGFHTYRVQIQGTDIQVWADDRLLLDGRGKFTRPAHAGRNQVGFGCASSNATGEAIWQWVRFQGGNVESPQVTIPEISGLEVQLGETRTIVPDAIYQSLFKLADGSLAVADQRSADGGRSWQPGVPLHVGAYQFPDGEIVQLGFHSKRTDRPGWFSIPLTRSTDGGQSAQSETALMHIAEATGGTGDDGKAYEGPVADHAIVALRDGSLLAAMYGQFSDDRVLVPTMPEEWKCYKYRTFVVRSTDRGKTWEYLATVAYDPSIGLESFCEADLLTLPGGEILCFMRTGGSGGKHTPLYLSRSDDDGKTWSAPEPIADRGVWPNACRMENGVLVCTYGRPGNWLAFSLDNGRTWTGHFCFYNGPTTSYNSVEEVAPGKLLVVYDRRQLDPSGNMRNEIVGTVVTIQRQ